MLQQKKPRILIVDDDKLNLISLAEGLKNLHADIDTTSNAKEAIYLISSQQYALLIFDVQMPEIGGFQLAEIIHNGYHNTRTPIIFISGVYFDEFNIFKGYRAGAVDYLTKPMNMEILQSKVSVFLDLEKAKQDLVLEKERTQKALDDKTMFVAKVSHEIRNPLGVVISIIDLLEDDLSEEERKEYVQIMKSSSGHMYRLLDDLVDYTKAEVGEIELERKDFHLKEEVEILLKSGKIQSKLSGNTFFAKIDEEIPDVLFGDITRYKQIAYNLLGNANKFTSKGTVKIYVSVKEKTKDSIVIATEIQDNGIGMTADEQMDLFKPFSQSNQSITRKYGGSGLGLAIAKKLSVLMGGGVEVKSEKGKGSSFIFTVKFRLS